MDPIFRRYAYSAERTRVIALDLAKNETGFAVAEVPALLGTHDEISWLHWGRLKIDKRNDKMMFLVGQELAIQVMAEIRAARRAGHNVAVIIEHPVFSQSRSAQQFLLFQSVLAVCSEEGVNVTTLSTSFLKAVVKMWVENPREFITAVNEEVDASLIQRGFKARKRKVYKGHLPLEKVHIQRIYDQFTHPANPSWPAPELVGNDDEYDAVFLAVAGLLFCTEVPDLNLPLIQFQIGAADSVESLHALPYVAKSLYADPKAFSPVYPRHYVNFSCPVGPLADILKIFRKNKYRTWGGKLDFPFNQLQIGQMVYARHREIDPAAAKALIKAKEGVWSPKRTKLDQDPESYLSVNYAGELYCHHPIRRLAAQAA